VPVKSRSVVWPSEWLPETMKAVRQTPGGQRTKAARRRRARRRRRASGRGRAPEMTKGPLADAGWRHKAPKVRAAPGRWAEGEP